MKISITRALAKCKIIKNRLSSIGVELAKCATISVGNKLKNNNATKEEFINYYANLENSYKDLQKNYVALKTAINKSNSTVVIENVKLNTLTLNDVTASELMAFKTVLEEQKEMLESTLRYYKSMLTNLDKEREVINDRIFKNLESLYSGNKSLKKGDENTIVEEISNKFEIDIVSLYKNKEELDTKYKNTEDDLKEIDFLLSEFNSKTEIEVDIDVDK